MFVTISVGFKELFQNKIRAIYCKEIIAQAHIDTWRTYVCIH